MKQAKTGSRIVFYPVPRFRRRNATAKIQTVDGLRVEKLSLFWVCGYGTIKADLLVSLVR